MSEHAHGPDEGAPGEWRKLALLAATSGVLGLLSLVAERFGEAGSTWALVFVAGACLAGGWDAAIDGWAALRQKRIDVHLLMIVVAC
jgi:Cd2+/Zn2+-exporting ATPase